MDSAKKMRLKGILHDIPKQEMYDQYAYLKQKKMKFVTKVNWEEKSFT